MSDQTLDSENAEGKVTARPCECCGHHEIGIVNKYGEYIPLRPGMQVRIIDQADQDAHNSAV